MLRITLELANLKGVLIDISQQAARRLAVEARRRHEHIALFYAARPCLRVQLYPIIPPLFRRKCGEVNAAWARIKGFAARFDFLSSSAHALV
jgi:hypothetical protein